MTLSQIDWYKNSHLSSYLLTTSGAGDSFTLLEAAQPAGDMSDPPLNDVVLAQIMTADVPYHVDFGAGRFSGRATKNKLYLAPAFAATDIRLDRPHRYRGVAFPFAKYAAYLADALPGAAPLDFGPLHSTTFEDPLILTMLERIWNAEELISPSALLFAEGAALVIIAELARLAQKPLEQTRGGLAPWATRRVIEYLHAHLADEVSLAELAAVASLSPFHFARMFKRTMGVAPHAFQRGLRCERSKEMLANTQQSVTEIAFEVGYESSQSFARMFRAETGTSPLEWRRQHFDVAVSKVYSAGVA